MADNIKDGWYVLAKKYEDIGNFQKALEIYERAGIDKQEWYALGKEGFTKSPKFTIECWKHAGIDKKYIIKSLDIIRKKYFFKGKFSDENSDEQNQWLAKTASVEQLMKKFDSDSWEA